MEQFNRNISVGIPTFNRANSVAQTLRALLQDSGAMSSTLLGPINVIVADNCSRDDTLLQLEQLQNASRVNSTQPVRLSVLENNINLGFQGNVLRLLDACTTEYLMLWSDEDTLSIQSLELVEHAMAQNMPSFASPQFFMDGRMYRGKRQNRQVGITEYKQAAGYISGLVISVPIFQKNRSIFVNGGSFSSQSLYPQVEVLQGLLAFGYSARWLPYPIGHKRDKLASNILMADGSEYFRVAGRIEQAKRSEAWLLILAEIASDSRMDVVKAMSDFESLAVIRSIQHALMNEESELLRSASRHLGALARMRPSWFFESVRRRVFRR